MAVILLEQIRISKHRSKCRDKESLIRPFISHTCREECLIFSALVARNDRTRRLVKQNWASTSDTLNTRCLAVPSLVA